MKKSTNQNPVISVGVINITTGKTQYDWSIYENGKMFAFLTSQSFLLLGSEGSLKPGDSYDLIGNDSHRSLSRKGTIIDSFSCEDRDAFIAWLKKHNFDYTPIKAFRARKASNRKLQTSYSLK